MYDNKRCFINSNQREKKKNKKTTDKNVDLGERTEKTASRDEGRTLTLCYNVQ